MELYEKPIVELLALQSIEPMAASLEWGDEDVEDLP